MKYFLVFSFLVLAGCQSSDPVVTCKDGVLSRCTESFFGAQTCESLIDAEFAEPVKCE